MDLGCFLTDRKVNRDFRVCFFRNDLGVLSHSPTYFSTSFVSPQFLALLRAREIYEVYME